MAGVGEGRADGPAGAAAEVDDAGGLGARGCKLGEDPGDGGGLGWDVPEGVFVGGADGVEEGFDGQGSRRGGHDRCGLSTDRRGRA